MTLFPFTQKKFRGLSPPGQHRRLIQWLGQIYQALATNRLSPAARDLFARQYTMVCQWQQYAPPPLPRENHMRPWLEWVSNAIHHHRNQIGAPLRDPDLLPRVCTTDKPALSRQPVSFQYHMALDGLRSLFNVGSIFRTCEAGGFQSIILGNIPGGDHPTIRKTAMGTTEWMAHTTTSDLAGHLLTLKARKIPIIGVETTDTSTHHVRFDWPRKAVIVMGNEEYGISSHVMAACDHFVHIPMLGRKNSINVACAASVIVFHVAACFMQP